MKHVAPVIALAIVALASCSSSDPTPAVASANAWGAMAVFDGPPSGHEASIAGRLVIEENCVVLVSGTDASRSLIVWPSKGTTWNPDRTITYSDGERSIELADGDYFSVGGGGGQSAVEWAASFDGWVAKPEPVCLSSVDMWWFVGGLPPDSN